MESDRNFTTFPGKQIYSVLKTTETFVSLLFYAIYYIPSSTRPNSKWTWYQALKVFLTKSFLSGISRTEQHSPENLTPSFEGSRFSVIHPAPSTSYLGVSMSNFEIQPSTIGGTWYPHRPSHSSSSGDVILHFHGGGFVIGDGRSVNCGFLAQTLLANTTTSFIFCPQYRLASNGGKFPAPLQDAITSFLYLTSTLQIPADRIVLSGDSAGGNIVLSLLRYMHDNPDAQLQQPGCAFLWSPWVELGSSLIPGAFEKKMNVKTDYICREFAAWGARSYAPLQMAGLGLESKELCFLGEGKTFEVGCPVFWSVGECEILFGDVVKAYEGFAALEANKMELQVERFAVHDVLLLAESIGMEETAVLAAKRAGEFWWRNREEL